MKIHIRTRAATVLYALIWAYFGVNHMVHAKDIAPMVPIPGGVFWVFITGVGMLMACIAIILNKKAKLACYLLALMLLIFIFAIHVPGLMNNNPMAPTMLLKDIGLMAGAIVIGNVINHIKQIGQ